MSNMLMPVRFVALSLAHPALRHGAGFSPEQGKRHGPGMKKCSRVRAELSIKVESTIPLLHPVAMRKWADLQVVLAGDLEYRARDCCGVRWPQTVLGNQERA